VDADSVTADTPPSSFGSPPYFHQSQQGLAAAVTGRSAGHLLRSKSGGCELFEESFNPIGDSGAVVMGSGINIPRVEQRDMFSNYMTGGVSVGGGFPDSGGSGSGEHDGGSVVGGSSDGRMGQGVSEVGTAGSDDPVSRELEDLGLQEGGVKRSGVLSAGNGKSRWDMRGSGQVVANGSQEQRAGTGTTTSDLNPEFEAAFVMEGRGIRGSGGDVSDSPLDNSPGDGDVGGTGEDAESEDTEGGRSKSEENESAEQGDDVWEGSVFPFCEEGELSVQPRIGTGCMEAFVG